MHTGISVRVLLSLQMDELYVAAGGTEEGITLQKENIYIVRKVK